VNATFDGCYYVTPHGNGPDWQAGYGDAMLHYATGAEWFTPAHLFEDSDSPEWGDYADGYMAGIRDVLDYADTHSPREMRAEL
jgi:hypothetical protein